jgi:hypothetical protein
MTPPGNRRGFLQTAFHFMLELIEQLWFIYYALLTKAGAHIPTQAGTDG